MLPRIAIIYLSYHSEPYLDDLVSALDRLIYPKDRLGLIIVDNPHPEYGSSVRAIEDFVMPYSGNELPVVTLLPQTTNLGFSEGNNVGTRFALEHGFEYVLFHNGDGWLAGNALLPLVAALEADHHIALAQALLILYPETNLINSSGNAFHFLGFGYCNDYREPIGKVKQYPAIMDIPYASGACLLVSTRIIREIGMWDPDFFLYHEDMEWSLRARLAGYRVVMIKDSIFYHRYQFSRSIQKFYWMERNRYGVLLMFFRWRTLVLLLPMALVMEAGLWLFAIRSGWVEERIKLYRYWLNPEHWQLWLGKRWHIQKIRKLRDRDLLLSATPIVIFQEKAMDNPVLKYFGNPLMKAYYWLMMKLIFW